MKFDHHDFDDDFGDYGSDDDDMDPRSRHRMDRYEQEMEYERMMRQGKRGYGKRGMGGGMMDFMMGFGGGFRGMRKRPPPDPRLEDKPRGGWTGKPVSWQVRNHQSFQAPPEIDPIFEDLGEVSTGPSTPVA